jgi:hypothetical protein
MALGCKAQSWELHGLGPEWTCPSGLAHTAARSCLVAHAKAENTVSLHTPLCYWESSTGRYVGASVITGGVGSPGEGVFSVRRAARQVT